MSWLKDRIRELTVTKRLRFPPGAVITVNSGTASESDMTIAEQVVLDGVTAGTVTASKGVVVDANKDIGDFRNVDAVNLDAGASGTAGTVDVYPATATKGKLAITKADNTSNDTTTLTVDLHGQATTVHVPDGGAAASYVVQSTAALTLAEADVLDGVTPGASAASKALVTDSAESLLWTTTDATAGETVTLDVEDTRTGAGATGWAIKGGLNTNVALGSYANGVYGILNFTGSGGAVTGLGAGVVAEIVMGAGTGAGTYASLELEIGMPTGALSGNSGTSFIYAQVYGADISTFDTNGYLLNLQGVTAGTSKMFMNVGSATALADFTKALRIKVGAVDYVIPLITAAEFAS